MLNLTIPIYCTESLEALKITSAAEPMENKDKDVEQNCLAREWFAMAKFLRHHINM